MYILVIVRLYQQQKVQRGDGAFCVRLLGQGYYDIGENQQLSWERSILEVGRQQRKAAESSSEYDIADTAHYG